MTRRRGARFVGRALLALLLLASGRAARAADGEPLTLAALGLKGQATYKNFSHFDETPHDNRPLRNEGILQVEWARRFAWGGVKLVVDARDDDDRYARGGHFQIPETTERRSHLNVKEVTLALRRGPVDVTVGKQVFAWGTADAFNPTDNLNPYDYLDVLDNEKLGVWSAASRVTVGPANLVFVAVPVFTPSRLPLAKSRWTPEPPAGFAAIVDDRELPGRDAEDVQYGARLKAAVAGWDVSVSYYDGLESTPSFRHSVVTLAPGVVVPRLTPVFSRIKVPGLDVSTTVGKFELHAEAAFRLVEARGRDHRFQGIAGFNHTWEVGLRWLDQVVVVLEYARETVLATRRHSGIVEAGGAGQVGDLLANNAFRDAVVGRLQLKLTEDTALKIGGHADLGAEPSHYLQVKGSHRLSDTWHVEAGLDFLTGSKETFWGRWRDNDRFFLVVKYLF